MESLRIIVRDAPFGQLVRYITGNRIFLYPEELPGFECPHGYDKEEMITASSDEKMDEAGERGGDTRPEPALEKIDTLPTSIARPASSSSSPEEHVADETLRLHPTHTLPWTPARLEAEIALHKSHTNHAATHVHNHSQAQAIVPTKASENTVLVDCIYKNQSTIPSLRFKNTAILTPCRYTTSDPCNPQNWPAAKKAWVTFLICLYTFVVYASSSIYVSSVELVRERFGVGEFKAGLGLALYVLGYGIGPLVFAPLSEVPQFGRNIPYITTFALYVTLAIPASLVDNFGGLMVLRFLLGLFGSPCLANGGANLSDMYPLLYLPYPLALWVVAMFAAPALGPLLSGFSVYALNWRWSQWEILMMSGPTFLLFLFFLPETQPTTILLRRAERLRIVTGNDEIRTQTEIDRKGVGFGSVLKEAIVKPVEICVKDPAILFVNLYTALTYGIYYSFFEVFALVYGPMYGFHVGETSIVFTCIIVGCFIALAIHFSYLKWYLVPDILENGLRAQEHRLVPGIFASVGPVVGLFIFGWTARSSIHWIVSVIGITTYAASCFILLQCIFTYVPMSYPQYAASLFAGNDFFRSLFAFGAVLFSRPMYIYLGVGKGISVLGGLAVIGIIGMYSLWRYGAKLRARSKFAV